MNSTVFNSTMIIFTMLFAQNSMDGYLSVNNLNCQMALYESMNTVVYCNYSNEWDETMHNFSNYLNNHVFNDTKCSSSYVSCLNDSHNFTIQICALDSITFFIQNPTPKDFIQNKLACSPMILMKSELLDLLAVLAINILIVLLLWLGVLMVFHGVCSIMKFCCMYSCCCWYSYKKNKFD